MSLIACAMLAGVVGSFLVERLVEALNLRALDGELPADWHGLYDAERYRTAQAYTQARTRFGAVVATAELLLLLVVWLSGGFSWLDHWAHRMGGGPIVRGLVFLGALGIGQLLAGLPARWWSTFVLEARFGFNRTTASTFWIDTAKGIALGVVLGGPLLAGVLWLFAWLGSSAWSWCWGAAAVWSIGLQYVAPTWILPLFSRFTPLAHGPVRDALLAYAARVEFPIRDVSVVDGSRRSTKANAFFTGFGRNKRIALFDTLLTTLRPDELLAVVAHEVGHYKRRHVPIGLALALVNLGVVFYVLGRELAVPAFATALGIDTPSVHSALLAFTLLARPVELPLAVALNWLSRRHEYQADRFAADTTRTPEALARGLQRLSVDTLANLTPHPAYVALHYSHPPVGMRVRALLDGTGCDLSTHQAGG